MPLDQEYPQRKTLVHTPPVWVDSDAIFFITINCKQRGTHQLDIPRVGDFIFESLQFRVHKDQWHIHLWLNMHDHIHALMSFSKDVSMKRSVAAWKKFSARQMGVGWQRGFFDHRIRDEQSFREKAMYIEANPVRAGFVENAEDWPYVWGSESFNSS